MEYPETLILPPLVLQALRHQQQQGRRETLIIRAIQTLVCNS
jgi:hypothetical protein